MAKIDALHFLYFMLTVVLAVDAISVSVQVFLQENPFDWMMLFRGLGEGLAAVGAFIFVAVLAIVFR